MIGKLLYILVFLGIYPLSLFGQVCYKSSIEKARFLVKTHQENTKIPGVQVALWIDGEWVWKESFGYKDVDRKVPVTDTTTFRVASVSKSLTSLALGKLIEERTLDPDLDIRMYLPGFPPKEYPITTKQLASSVSGIRHYSPQDPKVNQINYATIESSLDRFQEDPLLFEPRTDFHYSSYGWVLLSAVMEKASGITFKELMQDVWKKLEMNHTDFDFPDTDYPNLSQSFVMNKRGNRIVAPTENRSFMYAGGGMISSATDLVKAGVELVQPEFIETPTVELLTEPALLKNGNSTYYGLGWEVGTNRWGTKVIYHSGSMPGARSHLIVFPEEKLVMAYLANTGDQVFFNDREAHTLAELFLLKKQDRLEDIYWNGEWEIETTSLRNKSSNGNFHLGGKEGAYTSGMLNFSRSKGVKSFPIIQIGEVDGLAWFVAVSPMFLDLFLIEEDDMISGKWMHDFRIKGDPDELDAYWEPRPVSIKRIH